MGQRFSLDDTKLHSKLMCYFLITGNSRGGTLPPVKIFANVEEMGREGENSIAL